MGRAMRWIRGLLSDGGRKKPGGDRNAKVRKDKKDWSFAGSFMDKERGGGGGVGAEVGWRRGAKEENKGMVTAGSFRDSPAVGDGDGDAALNGGNKQNERAIMVAAATAKAAVAAAQAAASVVRHTTKRASASSWWSTQDLAAVNIQAVFRGYLARRALKALKGLVKLQAIVRGHIVRKRAVETLRCMQALARAQSRARAGREIRNIHSPNKGSRHYHHFAPTVAKNDSKVRINCANAVRPASLVRNGTRSRKTDAIDTNLLQSTGWNWLDHWMEERYWGRQEALSRTGIATCDKRNEKILKVDAEKAYLNSKRRNNQQKMFSSHAYDQNTRTYMTMPDSPSNDSSVAQYSVPSLPSVCTKDFLNPPSFPYEAEDMCESPHFYSVSSRTGSSVNGPFASVKSECSQSHYSGCLDYPNYMSNTESFRAKSRSRSAPRQRPEFEKSGSTKRSLFIGRRDDELSSTTSQRSSLHLKFSGKISYPGSRGVDKMGMPIRNL